MLDEEQIALESKVRQLCADNNNQNNGYLHVGPFFIKYGLMVFKAEATAQQYVWSHCESLSFQVPKVIHYFEDSSDYVRCGYLIMDYVDGEDGVVPGDIVEQALLELWSLPLPYPTMVGPFDDGWLQGYVWAETGICRRFESITDFNAFLNYCAKRRRGCQPETINFQSSELIVCHGDLSDRNFRMASNGRLYILDWAYAGVYPAAVEHFGLHFLRIGKMTDEVVAESLLKSPNLGRQVDESKIDKLWNVYRAMQVCDFTNL